jgi:transcriptional regulator with XRE-family HTH domain
MLDRIKALMAARQLSPSQFADQTTLPRPVVSHILSGRNKPSLEVAQKIMTAFPDVSVDWLLNGRGEMIASTALPEPPPAPASSPPKRAAEPVAARPKAVRPVATPAPEPPVERPPVTLPVEPLPWVESPSPAVTPAPPVAPLPPPIAPVPPPPVAAPVAEPLPAIAAALAGLAPAAPAAAPVAPLTRPERVVRRILVFYSDGSFSDHRPLPPEENPFL